MTAKKVSLICPYCPTINFINFNAFKNHASEKHQAQFFPILCVWCGKLHQNQVMVNQHVHKCAKELSETKKFQCEHCPTIFFCEDPSISTFYMAHMNQNHRGLLNTKWGEHWTCPKCQYVFPGQLSYQHHVNLCFQFGSVPKKPKQNIISNNFNKITSMDEKSRDGSSDSNVTLKVCGICCNSVSGKFIECTRFKSGNTSTLFCACVRAMNWY